MLMMVLIALRNASMAAPVIDWQRECQNALRSEAPSHLTQGLDRIRNMLQAMVRDNDIKLLIGQFGEGFVNLEASAETLCPGGRIRFHAADHRNGPRERFDEEAAAAAEVQDTTHLANQRSEFPGLEFTACNPGSPL